MNTEDELASYGIKLSVAPPQSSEPEPEPESLAPDPVVDPPLRVVEQEEFAPKPQKYTPQGVKDVEVAQSEKDRLEAITGDEYRVIYRDNLFFVEQVMHATHTPSPAQVPNAINEENEEPQQRVKRGADPILPYTVNPDPEIIRALKQPRNKHLLKPRFKLKQCYRSQFEKLVLVGVLGMVAAFPMGAVEMIFSAKELAELPSFLSGQRLATGFEYLSYIIIAWLLFKIMLSRLLHTYNVDEDDIEANNAFIARDIEQTLIDQIKNIKLQQGFIERILDYGTLEFFTAGSGKVDVTFENIRSPVLVKAIIEDRIRRTREEGDKFS